MTHMVEKLDQMTVFTILVEFDTNSPRGEFAARRYFSSILHQDYVFIYLIFYRTLKCKQ